MPSRIVLTDERMISGDAAWNVRKNQDLTRILEESRHGVIGGRLTAWPAFSIHSDHEGSHITRHGRLHTSAHRSPRTLNCGELSNENETPA